MDFYSFMFSVNITLITLVSNSYSQTLESQGSGSGSGSLECKYSDWSEWSECTHKCLSRDYLPTRYRTRKLISNEAKCKDDSLGTIQLDICADLPPCNSKKSIKTSIEISDGRDFNNIKRKKQDDFPEWINEGVNRYPYLAKSYSEYDEKDDEDNKYQIMKSVKNMGILSTKCGCSSGYSEVNFLTFIESEKMMKQLENLCRINIYNELVFEGDGRYIYYCLNNMIFKELENRVLTCEESENNEYVVCKKEDEVGTEWILFILYEGLKVLGTIVKDLLIFIYGSIASMVLIGLIVWWIEEKKRDAIENELE